MQETAYPDDLIPIDGEAARLARLSTATLRRMIKDGRLRGWRRPQSAKAGPRQWWMVSRADVLCLYEPHRPDVAPLPRPPTAAQVEAQRRETEEGLRRWKLG